MSKFKLGVYPMSLYEVSFSGLPYNQQPKVLKSLEQWAAEEQADIVYNLAHFNMGTGSDAYGPIYGRTVTYVHTSKGDIGYGGTSQQVTLPNGDKCSGMRLGIFKGVVQSGLSTGKTARNANGITKDGYYFHIQAENSSEQEVTQYCAQFADLMLFQDGGGSTGKVEGGVQIYSPEGKRKVPSVVCIRQKKGVEWKPHIVKGAFTFNGSAPSGGTQEKIDAIVLHHAAGDTTAQQVHQQHRAKGWWGIGYHYYIEQSGIIFEGRPEKFVGSHAGATGNYNTHSLGICLEGNFELTHPTAEQLRSLEWLIKTSLAKHPITAILGHKDTSATACPGKNFPLAKFQALLNPTPAPDPVEPAPQPPTLYRVQVGAFAKVTNANALLEKLKAAGFDGYIV